MSLGVLITTIVVTLLTAAGIIALFVWAAVKDGQDQDERDARVQHRSWPDDGA